jgi:hypothetical protein
MIRLTLASLCVVMVTLAGCDNRTRDAVRWDQIAEAQKANKDVQPWQEASSPWSDVQHHTGLAW